MKKTNIFQAVCVTVAGLMIVMFPNRAELHVKEQMRSQCSVESKEQYYRDFVASHDGDIKDQAKALEAAKKYLACAEPSDQEEILAKLNLAIGRILSSKNSNSDAIQYFIKAVSYNGVVKTSAQTYADLAQAYEERPYAQLTAAYTSRFAGKNETDESLLALENLYPIVDRMIDAYARAVALSGVQPAKIANGGGLRIRAGNNPSDWLDDLTDFYKFRHKGSDAGLKKMIETILSQPIPAMPIPNAVLPPQKKKN